MKKKETGLDFKIPNNKDHVDYNMLTDMPSRCWRRALECLDMNLSHWKSLLTDYLRWLYPDSNDPKEAKEIKRNRSTTLGNINREYFNNNTLTFPKLMTGLKILKFLKIELTIKLTHKNGKVYVIQESTTFSDTDKEEEKKKQK